MNDILKKREVELDLSCCRVCKFNAGFEEKKIKTFDMNHYGKGMGKMIALETIEICKKCGAIRRKM
jgi:hypothetical protein